VVSSGGLAGLTAKGAGPMNDLRTCLTRAATRAKAGHYDEAIADCDTALKCQADLAAVYVVRGGAHTRLGRLDQAIADFSEALKLTPENALAYYLRGRAHCRRQANAAAIADLDAALRLEPHNARAYALRAAVYRAESEHDLALADLARAVRYERRYAAAYLSQLGAVHAARGDLDQAAAAYATVLVLEPHNADARAALDRALTGLDACPHALPDREDEASAEGRADAQPDDDSVVELYLLGAPADETPQQSTADRPDGAAAPDESRGKTEGHRPRRREQRRAERRAEAACEAEEEHAGRVTAEKERLLEQLRHTNLEAEEARRSQKAQRPALRRRDGEEDESAVPWKRWVAVAAVALFVGWDVSYFWPDSGLKGVSGQPKFSRPAGSVAPAARQAGAAGGPEAQAEPPQRGAWGRGGL
jgi:tetratricopeptide (TPR) repeat protein